MDSPPSKIVKRSSATYGRAAGRRRQSSSGASQRNKRPTSDTDSSLTSADSSDDEQATVVTRKSSKLSVAPPGGRSSADANGKGKGKESTVDWEVVPHPTAPSLTRKDSTRTRTTTRKRKSSVGDPPAEIVPVSAGETSVRRKMARTDSTKTGKAPSPEKRSVQSGSTSSNARPTPSQRVSPRPSRQQPSRRPSQQTQSQLEPETATGSPPHGPSKVSPLPTSELPAKVVPGPPVSLLQPAPILSKPSPLGCPSKSRPNPRAEPDSPSRAGPSTPKRSRPSTPTAHSPTPSRARHERIGTPTRPARDLSALFGVHGHVGGVGSSPELSSPQKKRPATNGDDEVRSDSDDGGPASVLVNLPKTGGGGLVGRMLKRSKTAPDGSLSRAGSSTRDADPPVPPGSPLRKTAAHESTTGSSYFALSQSAAHVVPASPIRAGSLGTGAPSTPGSAPPSPGLASAPVRPPLGQRRTYGGGTRSMLASMEGIGGEGALVEGRGESYAALSKRWGIEDEGADSQDMVDLPTITELRARGENQRFLDDLGYIVDGLQAESVDVKRPSAVDLVRRLLNADFRRSVKTLDEAENLYGVLREAGAGDGDMVLDAALAVFLAILSQDERSLDPIVRRRGRDCFVVVGTMLASSKDDGFALTRLVAQGKTVKSKDRAAVNLLTELARIHRLAGAGEDTPDGHPLSLRAIASAFFGSIVGASAGSRVDRFAMLEDAGVSARVAAALEAEIEGLPARVEGHEKGLPLLPEEGGSDLVHIEHCLTVLENLVVRFPDAQQMVESTRPSLPALLGTLLVACRSLSSTTETETDDKGGRSSALMALNTLVTALRVVVNVTNTSRFWCEGVLACTEVTTTLLRVILLADTRPRTATDIPAVGQPRSSPAVSAKTAVIVPSSSPLGGLPSSSAAPFGGDESAETGLGLGSSAAAIEAAEVDVLCLSLGLLNNLVETVAEARDTVRETTLSSSCVGARACVRQCRCPDRRSGLLVLVDFYVKQTGDASTESSYLSGYSVLLLSHLLDGSPTNASFILDALPLPSPTADSSYSAVASAPTPSPSSARRTKLTRMASELRDFADVHQRFHSKLTSLTTAAAAAATTDEVGDDPGPGEPGPDVLPAVVPSVEDGVDAVRRMIGVLEGLADEEA